LYALPVNVGTVDAILSGARRPSEVADVMRPPPRRRTSATIRPRPPNDEVVVSAPVPGGGDGFGVLEERAAGAWYWGRVIRTGDPGGCRARQRTTMIR